MLHRYKPSDHILQLSTIICRYNNKLQRYNAGSVWGSWDPREGQQPFRLNPNEAGYRTTTLRPLLIGAMNSSLRFNLTPTFLEVILDRTLSFSKHVSLLKVKFSLVLRLYALRSPSLFCIKLFFGPFSLMLHSDGFLS